MRKPFPIEVDVLLVPHEQRLELVAVALMTGYLMHLVFSRFRRFGRDDAIAWCGVMLVAWGVRLLRELF